MTRGLLLSALLAAGCHAALHGDFDLDAGPAVDSSTSVAADAPVDTKIDAKPLCANGRVVFLNFDGVTLTQGASNSATDTASWMGTGTATIAAYQGGSATAKMAVESAVISGLAQFPDVQVRDERPPAGSLYVEIVFGGSMGQVGSPFTGAVQTLDCGDANKSDVGIVFNNITGQQAANFAIGAIGYGLGLTGTRDQTNCMCSWNSPCTQTGAACTLSQTAAINAADHPCTGEGATQDQVTPFSTTFCQ